MPYCASCGAHFRPEHPQTDVCDACWDHEFEADDVLITTNPENRIQTREHRIEDAIAAGVDPLDAPGYVDRAGEAATVTASLPLPAEEEDEGCPVDDPGCLGRDGDCHDACERPDPFNGAPRRTPEGQPTVADLVKPGMTVRTSYGTVDTVNFVSGPYTYEDHEHYTIVLGKPHTEGKGWLNECVAINGRIFGCHDDEITYEGEADQAAIEKYEKIRAFNCSYSSGNAGLSFSDLENLRRLAESIEWRDAEQGGKRYQRASVYWMKDGSFEFNTHRSSYGLNDPVNLGIELTRGWGGKDHVNVSCTIKNGCGFAGSCMSATDARKVINAWCKANPAEKGEATRREVNRHPLTPGYFCSVSFSAKGDQEAYATHGIVLALEGDQVRVRLNRDTSKPLGKLYPLDRVTCSHFDAMPFEKSPKKNKTHSARVMAEYEKAKALEPVPAAQPSLWIEPNGQLSLVPGKRTKPLQLDLFA